MIGINPGTRYIGFAIYQGSELADWGIKNLPGRWSRGKLKKAVGLISDMIGHNEIDILSIKRLHPSRSSHNLNLLVNKTKGLAKRKRLKVYQYSIEDMKTFFHSYKNKRQLAEVLASNYPVLRYELEKERTNMNPYYIRMFEAVALGYMCFRKLEKRQKRARKNKPK